MSTAPSKTGCLDSFAANLQGETEPATSTQPALGATTALAMPSAYEAQAVLSGALMDGVPIRRPTNPRLGVSDLKLRLKDGTPIRKNKVPLYDEIPVLFTVKFNNRPKDVDEMVMNVIISEISKGSNRKGRSGCFTKYVRSHTYEDIVPIVPDGKGYSITIEVGHAAAPSGAFHGGDGPYDVYISFHSAGTGVQEKAKSGTAKSDDDDDDADAISQIDETLRYRFYNKTHFLAR